MGDLQDIHFVFHRLRSRSRFGRSVTLLNQLLFAK